MEIIGYDILQFEIVVDLGKLDMEFCSAHMLANQIYTLFLDYSATNHQDNEHYVYSVEIILSVASLCMKM